MKKLIKTLTIIMSVLFLFSCSQSSSSGSNDNPDSQNPGSQNPGSQTPGNLSDLDTTFTPEELPANVGENPFTGRKFGVSNGSVEFLSDGTYKGLGYNDDLHKQTISIYDYTYDESTHLLARRLKSSNNFFANQTEPYTYQQVVDYFNSLNYADFASEMTEEEFKAELTLALENAKKVFGTVEYFTATVDTNGLHTANYFKTPNVIFTKEWIRFNYDESELTSEQINTLNGEWAYTSYGHGGFYVLKSNMVQRLNILSITADTITANEVDSKNKPIQNAKTYTFSYTTSCNDGILKITITAKDSVTQADLDPDSYKLESDLGAHTYPEIIN